MQYTEIKLRIKVHHIELLDKLKNEYGVPTKSKALELLLDDLLQPESGAEN